MPVDDGGSPAPIDRPVLKHLRDRLRSVGFVDEAVIGDRGHLGLRVVLAEAYAPDSVTTVELVIRWYENDDFSIHYREQYPGETWERRWDRHPNPHKGREHFHPPFDAGVPAEDASWPTDYRDVVSLVVADVEERLASLWGD